MAQALWTLSPPRRLPRLLGGWRTPSASTSGTRQWCQAAPRPLPEQQGRSGSALAVCCLSNCLLRTEPEMPSAPASLSASPARRCLTPRWPQAPQAASPAASPGAARHRRGLLQPEQAASPTDATPPPPPPQEAATAAAAEVNGNLHQHGASRAVGAPPARQQRRRPGLAGCCQPPLPRPAPLPGSLPAPLADALPAPSPWAPGGMRTEAAARSRRFARRAPAEPRVPRPADRQRPPCIAPAQRRARGRLGRDPPPRGGPAVPARGAAGPAPPLPAPLGSRRAAAPAAAPGPGSCHDDCGRKAPPSPRRLAASGPSSAPPLLSAPARQSDPLPPSVLPSPAPGAGRGAAPALPARRPRGRRPPRRLASPRRPGARRGMGGVEERGFLRGSDRTGQECAAGSAPRPACLAAPPRAALAAPPAMPHFTVVPVEDKHRAEYDSVEGLSWVDYREPAAAPAAGDSYDTVSSDGERARPGRGVGGAGRLPGVSEASPAPPLRSAPPPPRQTKAVAPAAALRSGGERRAAPRRAGRRSPRGLCRGGRRLRCCRGPRGAGRCGWRLRAAVSRGGPGRAAAAGAGGGGCPPGERRSRAGRSPCSAATC